MKKIRHKNQWNFVLIMSLLMVMAQFSRINLAQAQARAPLTLSAGVTETYLGANSYNFGSEGMARIKRMIFDAGLNSLTAHVRLGVDDPTSSEVYLPLMRSRNMDLEDLSARMAHTQGHLILKPEVSLRPELGNAFRLVGLNPQDAGRWLSHYRKHYYLFATLVGKRDIKELVLGVGLGDLWAPRHAQWWKDFVLEMRQKVGPHKNLSLELTSPQDFMAFTKIRQQYPQQFAVVAREINVIRLTINPPSTVSPAAWEPEKIAEQIQHKILQARELFGAHPITLANIMIPACTHPLFQEEVLQQCGTEDTSLSLLERSQVQSVGWQHWTKALGLLPEKIRQQIVELEIYTSGSDAEPAPKELDPRYLLFHPDFVRMVKEMQENLLPDATSAVPLFDHVEKNLSQQNSCLYYDNSGPEDRMGPIHSILLENLLGGFPRWKVQRREVSRFVSGDLSNCDNVFYLGNHYFLNPPAEFLQELAHFVQNHTVTWFNYKIDDFAKAYQKEAQSAHFAVPALGFKFIKINRPFPADHVPLENTPVRFYRFFDYKGETFFKNNKWTKVNSNFKLNADPEINELQITQPESIRVAAWARHDDPTMPALPYILQQDFPQGGALFYFADSPFSFTHYEDRYLILTDLLWDILKENPPSNQKIALVRLEDINPLMELPDLQWAVDYLADHHVPFSLALIPYYSNLFTESPTVLRPQWKPSYEYPDFWGFLHYAKARGAEFVFHGVAHQAGDLIGGFDGISGADYEFWMYPENRPVPNDSASFVLNLLTQGEGVFERLGVRPVAWETPHYASSALDSLLFAKLFAWTYHRPIYFKMDVEHAAPLQERHRFFDCLTPSCRKERAQLAEQLHVTADYSSINGQIFPYIIYKDVYGQAIIPESLGMVDYVFYKRDTWREVTYPEDILRRARKLKVIRGAIASFFWHPHLLGKNALLYEHNPHHYVDMNEGKRTLTDTIEGLQKMGYTFISIGDCRYFPQKGCH